MNRSALPATILRSALVVTAVSGCFAVVDVDRFKQGGSPAFQDLHFRLTLATSHVDNYFEYRVVDEAGTVRSRGIFDPMGGADIELHAPRAVPVQGGPFRLDFYADKIKLRRFEGLGPGNTSAHAWRVAPLADYPAPGNPNDGVVDVAYTHDTNFTDLNDKPIKDLGFAFKMRFSKMDAYVGAALQVRVSDTGTGQTLGLYRFPRLPASTGELVIPGIIQDLVYRVDVWADANRNNAYDNPASGAGDHGWRSEQTGAGAELVVDFTPDSGPKNVDVGVP
jgi:hypothetical protein